jgi:hypothetical protein
MGGGIQGDGGATGDNGVRLLFVVRAQAQAEALGSVLPRLGVAAEVVVERRRGRERRTTPRWQSIREHGRRTGQRRGQCQTFTVVVAS